MHNQGLPDEPEEEVDDDNSGKEEAIVSLISMQNDGTLVLGLSKALLASDYDQLIKNMTESFTITVG